MDDLPQLRDIHLPPEIMRFPLGYGFLTLLVIFLLLIVLAPYFRYLYLKSRKYFAFQKIAVLKNGDMADVRQISELLRRVCKIKHKKAVALYGKEWVDFLAQTTHGTLSAHQFDVLLNAPYAPLSMTLAQKDFEAIKAFAKQWLEDNL